MNNSSSTDVALAFQRWYLSLATEGMIPEEQRTALGCQDVFQRHIRGDQEATAMVKLSGAI